MKLIKNFSFLSLLQFFNLILPLTTYPYLFRVLGPGVYGMIAFAQAIVSYLVILVSFGFNITATREISFHRSNKEKINEIVSAVLTIKTSLFFIALALLGILVFIIPQAKDYKLLFIISMWACLYDVIFPIWYFQGIEQMKYITFITLISRLVFLALIFILVHKPEDYLLVAIINGIGATIAGTLSLWIFRIHGIKIMLQPFKVLKHYFLDSLPLFFSNLSTTLSLSTNKVLLGLFLGMQEVAYYELAEKLSLILNTPIHLIGQVIYPQIAKERNKTFLKAGFYITLIIGITILFSALPFSPVIIKWVGGRGMLNSVVIFRILLFTIIPVTVSLFFANIVLTAWGYNRDFFRIRLYTTLFYFFVIGILFFSNHINAVSLSVTTLLVESFIAVAAVVQCSKRQLNFLK